MDCSTRHIYMHVKNLFENSQLSHRLQLKVCKEPTCKVCVLIFRPCLNVKMYVLVSQNYLRILESRFHIITVGWV